MGQGLAPQARGLYLKLVDYFFDDDDLHFRSLIVPKKHKLDHAAFQQDHDDWYFKMYFDMIKIILDSKSEYRIYLDIKGHPLSGKNREAARGALQ